MSRFFSVFGLICFVFFNYGLAQTGDLLSGRWEYENIRKINSGEAISGSKLRSIIGENSFYEFHSNNLYSCTINNIFSQGEWKLSESNKLTLKSNGKTQEFEVIKVNKFYLVLYIKGEAFHTFTRQKHILPVSDPSAKITTENVYVLPEEVVRKWVLIEMHDSLEHQSINERMTSFVKGGWYDFQSQGTYVKKMVGHEKTGKWKLTEGNRTLIMVDDDGLGAVWHIGSVSTSRLVLHKPNSTMKHIFMALQ